jgi:hypothetical protein
MLFRLRASDGEAALCARLRDVVDRARLDSPLGESIKRVEYRFTAGDSVGMDDAVLLRTSAIEERRGGSGVIAWGRALGSSRLTGGMSPFVSSRDASCTGDMLTETDEGGVGTARVS